MPVEVLSLAIEVEETMAKRLVTWTASKGVLTATHLKLNDEKTEYDLHLLFPDYDSYNKAQQGIVKNGVKQRLVDKTTDAQGNKLTPAERMDSMNEFWEWLTVEGVYSKSSEKLTTAKKIKAAKEAATPEELEILKKLGL